MAKVIDSLECGKCGEIFHQLEVFIKHKMSNCSPEGEANDSDSKKTKKSAKRSLGGEANTKTGSKATKASEKSKNSDRMTPKIAGSKKSKMSVPEAESPKLKGVTGYLWKKRLLQEQQKHLMRAKCKPVMSEEEEGTFHPMEESSDSDSPLIGERCGQCSGCLLEEDCLECEVCLRKMEDPDVDEMCVMRECTAEADGEVYKVEKIIARRFQHGRFEYLIKWKGYSNAENTWEPKENILSPGLLEDFEKRQRLVSKRAPQTINMPRKRKKYYYTESSDDSSHDEVRASRMFSPASALDAQRGRSSKKAAMNFIKTVCTKGRRPSPEVVNIPLLMSSESESRSPSPEQQPRKKIIIEVPDPEEKGKYIRVKGEARKIKFLKDCDLQPVVDLGKPVPDSEEGIRAYIYEDIIQNRVAKIKERDLEKKSAETKSKPTGLHKTKGNEFTPKLVTPVKATASRIAESRFNKALEYSSEKKKRTSYQEKIESLLEKNAVDLESTLDDFDDGGDFKTLAELRESLRQSAKKDDRISSKPKVVTAMPKAGARKNFPRPLKPKELQSTSTSKTSGVSSSAGALKGKESSSERVFVVMPDGSMVEVSSAKVDTSVSKTSVEASQKKTVHKEKTKRVGKPAASLSKRVNQMSLKDCAGDALDDSEVIKLPNTLQLVQSELPLTEAENNSKLIGMFLFRQIISPNDPSQKCLLCPTKNTFRELIDLEKHYSHIHELASKTFKAEFSENIVFVCVPLDVTESTTLNSICRFCDITLKNLSEVRSHYPTSHNKVVRLVKEHEVTQLSSSSFVQFAPRCPKILQIIMHT
ncbi:zinc finger protein 26 [Caerostris extrusa]|uniref:Zinc finger protein 26 n=1 Tax=Caerostris extrusa TaxID=172846 RepID=A0AAV4PPH0_CAEEX|nr:zinc finger protein 26 [Caerostris extrusa]